MKRSIVKLGLGALAAGAAFLLADAWFLEKYFFRVKRFAIGKTGSRDRLRILLLTDLHFKKRFWSFHERLVKKINAINPDLILLTGDLIDEHGRPGPARRFFSRLKASIPKLVIPGNHDNKNKVSRQTLRKVVEGHNGRLLADETVSIIVNGTPLTITGLDDFIEGESRFADAVRNVGREEHHLLLVHSPLHQEIVAKEVQQINARRAADQQIAFQYIFAGHTHGGQVRVQDLVPVLPKKSGGYVNGWYNKERPFLYVSKGFGTSAIPFRFGARAEITVFEYGV